MSRLSTTLRIAAPAADVYDLIADPSRSTEWQTLLGEMGEVAGRPGGIGSSFVGSYRVAGRRLSARFVVTAAERPNLFQVNGAATGGWARWTTVLEPDGQDACTVRADLEYELPGEVVGSILGLLAGKRVSREFRRTYDSLRRVAEGAAADRLEAGATAVDPTAHAGGQLATS